MPTHLATLADTVDAVTITRMRTFQSTMEATTPLYQGRELSFQVVPRSSLGTVSVLHSDTRHINKRAGSEHWVSLSLSLPPATRGHLIRLERRLQDLLRPRYPQIERMWEANISPFVADVCVAGGRPCRFLDPEGFPVTPPQDWLFRSVVPVVHMRRLFVHDSRVLFECEITDMIVSGDDLVPEVTVFD